MTFGQLLPYLAHTATVYSFTAKLICSSIVKEKKQQTKKQMKKKTNSKDEINTFGKHDRAKPCSSVSSNMFMDEDVEHEPQVACQ